MSHDEDKLDFNKLQRELNAAVAMDAKYWRENDAKIRAVTEQRVATYDEFKELVAASHLKPLDRGHHLDNISENIKHSWNSAASHSKPQTDALKGPTQQTQGEMKVPNSGQEFARDWQHRHKTAEQQYRYLLHISAAHLGQIFKTEISFGLLGDILAALNEFPAEDTSTVLDILDSLRASSRFSLSLQFLSKGEKEVCEKLFEKLSQAVTEHNLTDLQEKVSALQSSYNTS